MLATEPRTQESAACPSSRVHSAAKATETGAMPAQARTDYTKVAFSHRCSQKILANHCLDNLLPEDVYRYYNAV